VGDRVDIDLARIRSGQPGVLYAGAFGFPLIGAAVAHFECRVADRYYGGDHEIFLGHVERSDYQRKPTLLFCHGAYHCA
jgi:flavin reductase (DIM6/NTAB) family NADH-FMN oxidoreductase RutF